MIWSARRTQRSEKFSATNSQSTSTTQFSVSVLVAYREDDHWVVDALGAPFVGERTEKQLITAFCDKIAELKPQLVTFNGNSFDLPVLRYRAMINEVSAPGLSTRPYFNRYTEDALDLCDVLSSFAPHTKASLHELSKIMGMPGKPRSLFLKCFFAKCHS
jgi:predicted PolB exonuclease-like 3'-5' exonuclease